MRPGRVPAALGRPAWKDLLAGLRSGSKVSLIRGVIRGPMRGPIRGVTVGVTAGVMDGLMDVFMAGLLAVSMAALMMATTAAMAADSPAAGHGREEHQQVERLLQAGAVAPFGRPMSMSSKAETNAVSGELLAIAERPLRDIAAALHDAASWCAVLVLHINNKGCEVSHGSAGEHIALKVARRYDQPVDRAVELNFAYRMVEATPELLSARLEAARGPFGTSEYLITLHASPAGEGRSLVRLAYAYRQTTLTGWAMDLYLSTFGRGKVGFSGAHPGTAAPPYVGGVRGILERNLMRYFLAIEAAAATPHATDAEAYKRRLADWFDGTERYPAQLHEVERETYLNLKRPLETVGTAARPPQPAVR